MRSRGHGFGIRKIPACQGWWGAPDWPLERVPFEGMSAIQARKFASLSNHTSHISLMKTISYS